MIHINIILKNLLFLFTQSSIYNFLTVLICFIINIISLLTSLRHTSLEIISPGRLTIFNHNQNLIDKLATRLSADWLEICQIQSSSDLVPPPNSIQLFVDPLPWKPPTTLLRHKYRAILYTASNS